MARKLWGVMMDGSPASRSLRLSIARMVPGGIGRIVEKADACDTPGEIGELLRREGLYSSHLSSWRKAAREGSLRGLAKKRGPRPSGGKREAKKVRKLERDNARLREELRKARIIIDVQGKVAGLLGVSPGDGKHS